MGNLKYIFIGVLAVISAFSVIFALFRGSGESHKKLLRFASLLCAAAAVCFGGNAVLACFDMGWRCTPFNIMLFLCVVLLIATLWHGMGAISVLEDTNPALIGCGFVSMILVMLVTLMWTTGYFLVSSWHDSLSAYDGQTIVCSNDMHGGSGSSWRYYIHVNNLVHGAEITRDDWWGTPPF